MPNTATARDNQFEKRLRVQAAVDVDDGTGDLKAGDRDARRLVIPHCRHEQKKPRERKP